MTSETEEAVARVEEFERHPALASWIERMANSSMGLSLGEWMIFLGALNRALASERERADRAESALSASQAEVERLSRERDEAVHLVSETATAGRDNAAVLRRALNAELGRRAVAEARATRAEALLEEAGEVLEGLANYTVDGVVLADHSRTFAAARAFLDKLKEQG